MFQKPEIPMDYEGIMGVPITFMNKYNPEQFEIIGATESKKGLFCRIVDRKKAKCLNL